jgi:hypothetical protein
MRALEHHSLAQELHHLYTSLGDCQYGTLAVRAGGILPSRIAQWGLLVADLNSASRD